MTNSAITVQNNTGLHSRPADLSVRTAKLSKTKSADARNIIKELLLIISQGSEIRIEAEAIADHKSLLESDFEKINSKVAT